MQHPNNNAIYPLRSCPDVKAICPDARCFVVVDGHAVPFSSYEAAGEWLQGSRNYRALDDVVADQHKAAEAKRMAYIESLNA